MKRLDPLTLTFIAVAGALGDGPVRAGFLCTCHGAGEVDQRWMDGPAYESYIQTYALSEVVLTAVVLGVVVAVGSLLRRRRREGEFGAGLLAWGLSIVRRSSPGSSGSPTCSA